MALKNKDGSTYKLSSPNPLMQNQNFWTDDYVVHNEIGIIEKAIDEKRNEIQINKNEKKQDDFISALDYAKEEVAKEVKKEEIVIKDNTKEKINLKNEFPKNIKKVFTHCLPFKEKIVQQDDLYGDTYKKSIYLDQISFESVIIQEEDLFLIFWTNAYELTIGSIVYPKIDSKRWWKIQSLEKKSIGYYYTAIPSNDQPSFD